MSENKINVQFHILWTWYLFFLTNILTRPAWLLLFCIFFFFFNVIYQTYWWQCLYNQIYRIFNNDSNNPAAVRWEAYNVVFNLLEVMGNTTGATGGIGMTFRCPGCLVLTLLCSVWLIIVYIFVNVYVGHCMCCLRPW